MTGTIGEKIRQHLSPRLEKIRPIHHYLYWRYWEKEQKVSFFINLGLGILLALLFFFIVHLQFMENLFNSTMDKLIKRETLSLVKLSEKCFKQTATEKECALGRSKISPNIVFIDIDSDTYGRWGEPLFIPRGEIARYLRLAEKNRAAVVYLDTLFDYPSLDVKGDRELRGCLEEMTRRGSSLKIIFPTMKSLRTNQVKGNIFDPLIDKNPSFFRGFPYASFTKTDKVVRYVRYYDVARGKDGRYTVLWAAPVLSMALFTGDYPKLRALEPRLIDNWIKKKTERLEIPLSNGGRIEIGNNELFMNRIRFALLPPGTISEEGNLFGERILPEEVEAMQGELAGKVVIIGTSSPDKEGWYPTPVGDMAGIYIIGNATNMFLGNWQVRDAPLWLGLLINLVVVIFGCYMFVHFSTSMARTVAALFGSFVLVPVTYYFYSTHGIFINTIFLFINMAVPVMAMGSHRIQGMIKKFIIPTVAWIVGRFRKAANG